MRGRSQLIGIIGAMDEEVAYLLSKMTEYKEVEIANCHFYHGIINEKEVVLLKSGIGKANAAMATTILHERFAPQYVINTGSAGGISDQLEIGDVVISDQIIHHDVDVTAFDYKMGQVPGMPATFKTDDKLTEMAHEIMKEHNIPAVTGWIATGDSFLNDMDAVKRNKKLFPNVIANEMEAAAIAQVCFHYGTPYIVIRALSDIAGKESSVSFDAFLKRAANNSSTFILSMIDKLEI